MNVLTSAQMRIAETLCVEREGITYLELMERAGRESAAIIMKRTEPCNAVVLCGKGKNGGDGFVIARHLSQAGYKVKILLVNGQPKAEDAVKMFSMIDKFNIETDYYIDSIDDIKSTLDSADIFVECIFGTGFEGAPDARTARLIYAVNESGKDIYSIDVPACVDCDNAIVNGTAVRATLTIAISSLKAAHIMKNTAQYCGKTVIADIGITVDEHIGAGSDIISFSDKKEVVGILPVRPADAHKGTFGHALNICGSKRMQGAAVLAAKGACRMGTGLVTAAFPDAAYGAVSAKLTEPLLLSLPCDEKGFLTADAFGEISEKMKKATAILAGCGLGVTEGTKQIIQLLLLNSQIPVVIDADGLNIVAENPALLDKSSSNIVITPHPGEMSRLCGKTVEEITENPIRTALRFAKKHNITVVLKSANTVVCAPDCPVYINSTGNSGLARGGSGDLLAGMIVSLLSQGMSAFYAACCAVYLHGLCADRYAEEHSSRFILPGDLADNMAQLLSDF
ncbi:MAG: NAD(P)H-hydrate dehydratase [Clostridia bacterium]|nr:NAD(P)H-hydrate dehydratase [Clostridia bacterium]